MSRFSSRCFSLSCLVVALLLFGLSLAPSRASAKGFCDTRNNCTERPWRFSETLFSIGYLYVQDGGLLEHAIGVGARARIPTNLAFTSNKLITELALFSHTRVPEVGAFVGTVLLRAGLLIDQVGFTIGAKAITSSPYVLVRPWSLVRYETMQFYPSMKIHWRPGLVAFSLSLFDTPDTAIGRFSIEVGSIGASFSFPYGGEVFGRFELMPGHTLHIRLYANWLPPHFAAGLTMGWVWGQGSVYQYTTPPVYLKD